MTATQDTLTSGTRKFLPVQKHRFSKGTATQDSLVQLKTHVWNWKTFEALRDGRNTITSGRGPITRGRITITSGRGPITRGINAITRGRRPNNRGRSPIARGRNGIHNGRLG